MRVVGGVYKGRVRDTVGTVRVSGVGVCCCGPCWCSGGWYGGQGLLRGPPLLWKSCTTFGLPAPHSTPSTALSDLPLPVIFIIVILILVPVFVGLDIFLLAIQECIDLIPTLLLLLPPSLLLLALSTWLRRAEGFGSGRCRTAVLQWAAGWEDGSCRGGKVL